METGKIVKSKKYIGVYVKKELGNVGEPDSYYVVVLSRNRSKTLVLTNMNDYSECSEEESNKFMEKLKKLGYTIDTNKCEFVYKVDESLKPNIKVGDIVKVMKTSDDLGLVMSVSMKESIFSMNILYIENDGTLRSQSHSKDIRRFGGVEKCNEEESSKFKQKLSNIVSNLVS